MSTLTIVLLVILVVLIAALIALYFFGKKKSRGGGMVFFRFIKWIAIALAIGLPMAVYLIEQWRMQYAFRPQLTVWIFIAAAFIVLAVKILTVIWQYWKAARVNPEKNIKTE